MFGDYNVFTLWKLIWFGFLGFGLLRVCVMYFTALISYEIMALWLIWEKFFLRLLSIFDGECSLHSVYFFLLNIYELWLWTLKFLIGWLFKFKLWKLKFLGESFLCGQYERLPCWLSIVSAYSVPAIQIPERLLAFRSDGVQLSSIDCYVCLVLDDSFLK